MLALIDGVSLILFAGPSSLTLNTTVSAMENTEPDGSPPILAEVNLVGTWIVLLLLTSANDANSTWYSSILLFSSRQGIGSQATVMEVMEALMNLRFVGEELGAE